MDKIKIYSLDKQTAIEMPRVKDITVGAEEVANTVTMASGKVVKDMIGYRTTLKAGWDYVPANIIAKLSVLLRTGSFFYVEYPAPTGADKGTFSISFPDMKVFCFKDGVAVWHDVTLKMTAQEVS